MKATLTSKGQITIPIKIRQRLGLQAGQVLEFDEETPYLKAVRVIPPGAWDALRAAAEPFPEDHPWSKMSSMEILDDMRGPVELPPENPDDNGN